MKLNCLIISCIIFWIVVGVFAAVVLITTGCNDAQQVPQPPNQISSVNPASWIDVNSWGEWQNLQVLTVTKNLAPITAGCIALGIIGVILIVLGRTTIGIALICGAIAGVGLVMGVDILATHEWAHWLIGGVMVVLLLIGGAYLFLDLWDKIKKAKTLTAVIDGNEKFKAAIPLDQQEIFKAAQNKAQGSTPEVKSAITKTVDKIRRTL